MKKKILVFVLPLSIFLIISSCKQPEKAEVNEGVSPDLVTNPISADGTKEKTQLPVMEFETTVHDFGTIVQGEKVAHTFKFKNTGGADLIISDASASCGCTVPKYSRKPVKPGQEGEIDVVFDSAGRTGAQHKTISVLTNAQPNTIRLEIDSEVIVVK